MCGIIGYIGKRQATGILVDGLRRLEYRGYDSAGLAVLNRTGLVVQKSQGKLRQLVDQLQWDECIGNVGIGHTRWATHGIPNIINAHPHADSKKKLRSYITESSRIFGTSRHISKQPGADFDRKLTRRSCPI